MLKHWIHNSVDCIFIRFNCENEIPRILKRIINSGFISVIEQYLTGVAGTNINNTAAINIRISNQDRTGVRCQVGFDHVVVSMILVNRKVRLNMVLLVEIIRHNTIVYCVAQNRRKVIVVCCLYFCQLNIIGDICLIIIAILFYQGCSLNCSIACGICFQYFAFPDDSAV